VQKEIASVTKAGQKHANDAKAWQAWLVSFYDDHAGFVGEVLKIPSHQAKQYATARRDELAAKGLPALADWDARVVPELAGLALGDEETREAA
jgi:hypothetical protein